MLWTSPGHHKLTMSPNSVKCMLLFGIYLLHVQTPCLKPSGVVRLLRPVTGAHKSAALPFPVSIVALA